MIKRALLTLLLFAFCSPAYANEVLNFKRPKNYKERLVIDFINQQAKTPPISYLIAPIDLNNDFINEYIIKPTSPNFCASLTFCPHKIIALPQYKPLLIGDFRAHHIIVEDSHAYGVRNLKIYDNKDNNFTFSTARWNPFSFSYEEK